MEPQVHGPCELVSFGKVSHCGPPQGQVLCPPACSFGDGQCWPHLLISQYFSQHRATCKVREARAFIATELSPIYVLYSTHDNGGTGTARKVSAEDRTTKKHRMFGVGRDLKKSSCPISLPRGIFQLIRLFKAQPNPALSTARDGPSTTSLSNQFLCLTTPTAVHLRSLCSESLLCLVTDRPW